MLKWPFPHYVRFFPLRWYGSITSKLAIGSWPLMMIVVQSYVTNSNSSKLCNDSDMHSRFGTNYTYVRQSGLGEASMILEISTVEGTP